MQRIVKKNKGLSLAVILLFSHPEAVQLVLLMFLRKAIQKSVWIRLLSVGTVHISISSANCFGIQINVKDMTTAAAFVI